MKQVVVEVQVVGQILVSAEMIGESANLVTAELPRIGTAKIERLHCVSPTLEDDREELRIVELSEKETGQLRERPKPRLLRSVERLFYQSKLSALSMRIHGCFTTVDVLNLFNKPKFFHVCSRQRTYFGRRSCSAY